METAGKMDCNNLNYLQRLTPKVYPPPSASTLHPTSSTGGCTRPGPSPHLIQQQQQQNHRIHHHHPYPPQQQSDQSIYYSHQQSQQHPQQLYHGASPHLTPSIVPNFQNSSIQQQLHGHQGNLIGHSQGQQQPKVTTSTSKGQPQTASVPVTINQGPHQTGPGIGSSSLTSSPDMELESMIVLFVEKRKELNQSLAKVEALSRQLEELKSGINGTTTNYNRITNNPMNRVIGDKFDDLEKLRQELANQTRLNDQQNVTLMHKQNLLVQRKCEIAGIDERISELQKRLAMKRMLNQQLSSQMKSRTGVAYGLPNDNTLNSGNPRLRSSVGPCNTVRLNNNYNRNNATNTNVAAVEPFQRSTVGSNNYPAHSYDKSDENVDPIVSELPPSKHFQNLPYRNKFSPVELNSSNAYPASVNNTENTTNINNKTNCILNSHQNHNHHHQQQQPFHLPLSHHHQLQQQQMQLQRQHQHHHHHHQQYASVGNSHKNGKNMNMSLANEMIMSGHTESTERCDENGTCEHVRPQSDGVVGGGENTLINSPLKHKIHLRDRPSPSGSSSSSSDQLPAGYSPSKKVLNANNIDNGVNNGSKSLNSVNHSSSNDYYGSRGVGGTIDGDNNNETMMVMGNCDYYNNPNSDNYRCSEPISGYDDTTSPTEHHQLIDCIRKNSRMVNHHQQSQQQLQKQQSELIEKCVSDLPNANNNGNNNQNCSSLDEDDRSSLSGPSVTSSSGSNSSNHHHSHPQNHHNLHHHHQQSTILFNDDDNGSQLKGIQHNLRKSSSTSAVPTLNRLTPSNCGTVYQQSTNYTNNNKDSITEHHHHHHVPSNQQAQQYHHQYHHHHQQSNSFIRNSLASNNQESQIPSSFYDYSPSSSSSNNIYSCSIDVPSRSLTNDANSSLSSSITTTISSTSLSTSSSVPQSHHQQHLSSCNLSPSSFKNGYQHPSSSSSSSLRESNSQKLHPNNKVSVDEVTISSSSERLPPTVKEGNTGSNNSFQSMNQVNNKHQHQQQQQQQHLHNLHHRYQIQHRDGEDDEEGNVYEEDADDTNHVSNDDDCKTIESRSSKPTTSPSTTINQNNAKNSINSGEPSAYSRGDEMITNDATNNETSKINNKRRPVIADNKIEKELDGSGPTKSFERKPLNFQWPPPQYQSINHQQSKSITNKPDEGKKVTWAKKRILSKTTDDLRSPTKDSFCLKETPSLRPSSMHLNGNRTQKQDNGQDDDDHLYHHQQSLKMSIDNKNNLINSFNNANHCNKIKSSLKKDGNGHRLNQKKDHEGLIRRVSFDPLALLLDAALEGELDLVKKTSKIQDVSAANDEGITALHNTICAGHFEIVKYLVEIGCDVNAPDSDGWTPLHCAASCNNLTMVKYLVEHGACVFATTFPDKETAAQKCEEGEEGFDRCSQYLLHIQESLGIMNDGIVYAVYDYDAQSSDELNFKDADAITILRRGDEDEKDWWWARLNDKEGYVPRNLLGLYPRVKANKQDKVDAMD